MTKRKLVFWKTVQLREGVTWEVVPKTKIKDTSPFFAEAVQAVKDLGFEYEIVASVQITEERS